MDHHYPHCRCQYAPVCALKIMLQLFKITIHCFNHSTSFAHLPAQNIFLVIV